MKHFALVAATLACFALGLFFNQIGLKTLSIISVFFTLMAILVVPTQISVVFIVCFVWFQGFFKVISNYNPVVHVGADLVVIVLLAKIIFFGIRDNQKSYPPLTWLFVLHFLWVLITYLNPYSLGIVATIAGSKVYVSMFLLYFLGYFLTKDLNDVKQLFYLFIVLAFVQTVVSIYQGFIGPESVTSIHPRYQIELQKYGNYSFRPFGLTHLPGGPSVYIYMVLPFISYFIYEAKSLLGRTIYVTLLPLIGVALFLCQIRSAIGKAVIGVLFFILALNTSNLEISFKKRVYHIFGSILITVVTVFSMLYLLNVSVESFEENEEALERSFSTFDISAMSKARRGALDRFLTYASEVPFGAGFSRVGAARGAFKAANAKDPFFSENYFFADNLFIHILIELGFPGLIIITGLVLLILYIGFNLWWREVRSELIGPQLAILSSLLAIFLGSYGGEGIIYNPESCFFWLFSGVMMSMKDISFNAKF